MFRNNLTRVKWSKKTSSHDGMIMYKIWTLCNVCYSSIVTLSFLCNVHIHLSLFPVNATALYGLELTCHIYPNTRQEFFLNLTHLKNLDCLLTVHKVKHTLFVHIMKTNSMHYLSSVYFVSQLLHVWGIFVAHHQEVYCIYTTVGTYCAF
jgi:hypothetical protein